LVRPQDVVLELPPTWRWQQRDRSPLGIEPASEVGVLQISSPSWAPGLRGVDLEEAVPNSAEGYAITEFFRAPDPRVVAALERGRRPS
jgi:hypothetical protein